MAMDLKRLSMEYQLGPGNGQLLSLQLDDGAGNPQGLNLRTGESGRPELSERRLQWANTDVRYRASQRHFDSNR